MKYRLKKDTLVVKRGTIFGERDNWLYEETGSKDVVAPMRAFNKARIVDFDKWFEPIKEDNLDERIKDIFRKNCVCISSLVVKAIKQIIKEEVKKSLKRVANKSNKISCEHAVYKELKRIDKI